MTVISTTICSHLSLPVLMFQLKTFSSFECRSMLSFHFLLTHHLLILYLGFAHFVPSLLHTLMMSQKFEIGKNVLNRLLSSDISKWEIYSTERIFIGCVIVVYTLSASSLLLRCLYIWLRFSLCTGGYKRLWIYLCTVKTILYKPNQTKPICLFIWIHSF